MVKERITTIEDLIKILELMIDKKGGIGGYIDDVFEIKKSEKAFLIKSKENTTTIEIPHSNCFSIEENVKRFEYALSCIGITKGESNSESDVGTITHSELMKTQQKPIFDNVNHPNHYNQGKIECIEAMKAMLTKEEFRGFLRGSIFKYQWRVMDKNGIEDLEKAQWYLNYLIKELRELDKE